MEKFFVNKTLETGRVTKDSFKRDEFVVINSFTIKSIKLTEKPLLISGTAKFYETIGEWEKDLGVSPKVDFDEKTLNELYKNGISTANFPIVGKLFWRLKK